MLLWILFLVCFIFAAERIPSDLSATSIVELASSILPDEMKSNLWRIKVKKDSYSYVWLPSANSRDLFDICSVDAMKELLSYDTPYSAVEKHCFKSMFWPAIVIQYMIPVFRRQKKSRANYDILNDLIIHMKFPSYVQKLLNSFRAVRKIMNIKMQFPIKMGNLTGIPELIKLDANDIFDDIDRYMAIVTSFGFSGGHFLKKLKELPDFQQEIEMGVVESPNDPWSFLISAGVDIRKQLKKVTLSNNELVPLNLNFDQMNGILSSADLSPPDRRGLKRKRVSKTTDRESKYARTTRRSTRIKDAPSQVNGLVNSGDSWLEHATMAEVADKLLPESVKNELWRFETAPGKQHYIWLPTPKSPLLVKLFPMNDLKILTGYVSNDALDSELGFKEFFWPSIMMQYLIPSFRNHSVCPSKNELKKMAPLMAYPDFMKSYIDAFRECRSIAGSRRQLALDIHSQYNSWRHITIHPDKIVDNPQRYMAVVTSFGLDEKVFVENFNEKFGPTHMLELGSYKSFLNDSWSYVNALGIDIRTLKKVKIVANQFVVQKLTDKEKKDLLKYQCESVEEKEDQKSPSEAKSKEKERVPRARRSSRKNHQISAELSNLSDSPKPQPISRPLDDMSTLHEGQEEPRSENGVSSEEMNEFPMMSFPSDLSCFFSTDYAILPAEPAETSLNFNPIPEYTELMNKAEGEDRLSMFEEPNEVFLNHAPFTVFDEALEVDSFESPISADHFSFQHHNWTEVAQAFF